MKTLHSKKKNLIFAPNRAVFEEAFDIEQTTETEIAESANKLSTDIEKISIAEAVRIAKGKIDDIASKAIKKIKSEKGKEDENKPYIEQILAAQKTAKEGIDRNMETYRNIQKYFKLETEIKILLTSVKDAGGDKEVTLEGAEALALLAKLKPLSIKLDAKYTEMDELNLASDETTDTRRSNFRTNELDTLKSTLSDNVSRLRGGVLATLHQETISKTKGDKPDDPTTADFDESKETVVFQLQAKGVVSLADIASLEQKAKEIDDLLAGIKKMGSEDDLLGTATSVSLNYHAAIEEAHKSLAETDKTGKLAAERAKLPKLKKNFEDAKANRDRLLNAGPEEKSRPDYKQRLNEAYSWYKGTQKAYGDQQLKVGEIEDAVDKVNLASGVYVKGVFEEEVPAAKLKVEGIDEETGKAVDWLDTVGSGRRITVQGVNIYVDRIARKGENQFSISADQNKDLGLKKDIIGSKEFILKEIARIAGEKGAPSVPKGTPDLDVAVAKKG